MVAIGRVWKPVLFVAGLLLAALFLVVYRQVLYTVQKPSWPPPPGAITSAGARAATEEFAARSRPRVADVGLDYAWSTAAGTERTPSAPRPTTRTTGPRGRDVARVSVGSTGVGTSVRLVGSPAIEPGPTDPVDDGRGGDQ